MPQATTIDAPLASLEEWEESLKERYPEPGSNESTFIDANKPQEAFRNYESWESGGKQGG